ncbi:hypothetical protein V3N95_03850 [Micrococcaceae bacterium Sec6.3]
MNNTPATGRPSDLDNMRQQVRFHMERAERFRIRAEKAEAELKRRDDGTAR